MSRGGREICSRLPETDPTDENAIDRAMAELDATEQGERLGGNVLMAGSAACARRRPRARSAALAAPGEWPPPVAPAPDGRNDQREPAHTQRTHSTRWRWA